MQLGEAKRRHAPRWDALALRYVRAFAVLLRKFGV
jgi:hypothetical protein